MAPPLISTRAHFHRGESTGAANSSEPRVVQLSRAAPGGSALRSASQVSGQTDATLLRRRGKRGVEMLMDNMKTDRNGTTLSRTAAVVARQEGTWCPRRERKLSSTGRRPKFVKTGYGNWIRWNPPLPKFEEKNKSVVPKKRKEEKARKMEKVQVQLKKKVAALEKKNAALQVKLQGALDRQAEIEVQAQKSAQDMEAKTKAMCAVQVECEELKERVQGCASSPSPAVVDKLSARNARFGVMPSCNPDISVHDKVSARAARFGTPRKC